ncbi:hypothetical protein SLEP1_g23872 [Rubroshorea leprosula]|nr:hypothetical protein SLEP1_g23872 [Rubroshorea leprosula]
MDRWSGVLKVRLDHNSLNYYKVAASLCFSSTSKTLTVAAVALLRVQPEPSYGPLITDVLHSLVPLVPVELGGTLRQPSASSNPTLQCHHWHISRL